jgi:uncharacterized RmlC-like cupin family protein
MEEQVRRVSRDELVPGQLTPGMTRHEAVVLEGLWSGLVETEPGAISGWHHHGDHETIAYVVSGRMRLEFGPGGTRVVEAGRGDFLRVPAGLIHREGNPTSEQGTVVVVRSGHGPVVVNVDGPDPS